MCHFHEYNFKLDFVYEIYVKYVILSNGVNINRQEHFTKIRLLIIIQFI